MESFSPAHWLVLIVAWAFVIVPLRDILNKVGYSGWWAVLVFLPLGNIIALWIFAGAKWPNLKTSN